jgi:hypothetical protein
LSHQLFITTSKIEQIELTGVMFLGAPRKAEFAAEQRVLVIDLTRNSLLRLDDNPAPENNRNSAKQQDYDDKEKTKGRVSSSEAPRLAHLTFPARLPRQMALGTCRPGANFVLYHIVTMGGGPCESFHARLGNLPGPCGRPTPSLTLA